MQMKDLESGKEHVANILQQHDFRLCCTGTNVVSSSCNIISFTSCISMILNMFGWTMIAIFIALSRSTKISALYIIERCLNLLLLTILGICMYQLRSHMSPRIQKVQLCAFLLTCTCATYSLVELIGEVNDTHHPYPFHDSHSESSEFSQNANVHAHKEAKADSSFPTAFLLLISSSAWEFLYYAIFCYQYAGNIAAEEKEKVKVLRKVEEEEQEQEQEAKYGVYKWVFPLSELGAGHLESLQLGHGHGSSNNNSNSRIKPSSSSSLTRVHPHPLTLPNYQNDNEVIELELELDSNVTWAR